jgi:hydrogenase/urease accessory protein HupE
MIVLAIIATVIVGYIMTAVGFEINATELGPIFAIATMGGFILYAVRKNKPKE